MLLDQPSSDIDLAVFLMDACWDLFQDNTQAQMDKLFTDLGLGNWVSVLIPSSVSVPTMYCGGNGLYCVTLFGGTSTILQGANLQSSYLKALFEDPLGGCNSYLYTLQGLAQNLRIGIGQIGTRNQIYAGHSLGGSAAVAMAAFDKSVNLGANQTVVTFGAPRTGPSAFRDIFNGIDCTRWMNSDDPVPLVPPRLPDVSSPSLLTFPIGYFLFMEEQVHVPQGQIVSPIAVVTMGDVPNGLALPGFLELGIWLAQLDLGVENFHSPRSYSIRLKAVQANFNARFAEVALQVQRPLPQEPPGNALNRDVGNARRLVERGLAATEVIQTSGPTTIPALLKFRVVNLGKRSWGVFLGAYNVAISTTRRSARAVAKHGNEFLQVLQHQAIVGPQELIAGLQAYLDLAATLGSGITPTMNTTS
jgi:hypothetical protein